MATITTRQPTEYEVRITWNLTAKSPAAAAYQARDVIHDDPQNLPIVEVRALPDGPWQSYDTDESPTLYGLTEDE